MNSEEKYAGAIAELIAQRAALEAQLASVDTAIAALRALQTGGPIPVVAAATVISSGGPQAASDPGLRIELDTFHNQTLAESIKKYLGMRNRKPATTQEIVEALREGGQKGADGANFHVVVNNSLNRMSASDGDVSKVRKGVWGLKSWYSKGNGG